MDDIIRVSYIGALIIAKERENAKECESEREGEGGRNAAAGTQYRSSYSVIVGILLRRNLAWTTYVYLSDSSSMFI